MRLAGAALFTAAGLLAGLCAAGELRERAALRSELVRMLTLMAFELDRFRTPLPALFGRLADQLAGQAGALCREMRDGLARLDGRPLAALWTAALEVLPGTERRLLLPLGQVLGRYGAEEQSAAIAACREAMEQAREEAADALRERGRMAVGVFTAGAAALAVLLL